MSLCHIVLRHIIYEHVDTAGPRLRARGAVEALAGGRRQEEELCLARQGGGGERSFLLHYGSRRSADNEFSMHAAAAPVVARHSQSKRHGARKNPERAGASSSAGGTKHEPAQPRRWGASTRSRGGFVHQGKGAKKPYAGQLRESAQRRGPGKTKITRPADSL